jgi:hypothetical protein
MEWLMMLMANEETWRMLVVTEPELPVIAF